MYPYDAGDRVMIGIITWQYPQPNLPPEPEYRQPEGPRGPYCRYFVPTTVVANDREAGVLVVDAPDWGYDVYHYGEFNGEEVVSFEKSLPLDPRDAHRRALLGEIY